MMIYRNAIVSGIDPGRLGFSAQKNDLHNGGRQIRLLSVDNNRSAIMVNISVVIALLDDDGSVPIPMITVADDVAITVPVAISVTLTNRYANVANTNSDLFCSSRHCPAYSSCGGDNYGILNHCVLLSLLSCGKAMLRCLDRSGSAA
jgi:hypothetical protein